MSPASEFQVSQGAATLYQGRKAQEKLRVVIVGGGLGGLAAAYCLGQAGHEVTVLESAPSLGDVGAGIQVCPNLSRLLIRWGLEKDLKRCDIDKPSAFTYIRYNTGEQVGMALLGEKMERDHGAPWYAVHRTDLYDMLHSIAKPHMSLRLCSRVKEIAPSPPSVTLESGEKLSADLIIGADGIHSIVRGSVIGETEIPLSVPLGDVAFRALIPTEDMIKDPELRKLVENPQLTCWMGPMRHSIGYCVRGKKEYNMVLVKPDDGSTYSWTAKGDVKEVKEGFAGWEPRFQKLIDLMPSVLKSKLLICSPLKTWTNETGEITLLGDACHPMLPYRAQGAAMAIEDAAVLGNLFSRLSHRPQIPLLLKAYEEIRSQRATAMQTGSLDNRTLYHLHDGPEQENRDASMRRAMQEVIDRAKGVDSATGAPPTSINPWADKTKMNSNFSYDVDEATDEWWRLHGSTIHRDSDTH